MIYVPPHVCAQDEYAIMGRRNLQMLKDKFNGILNQWVKFIKLIKVPFKRICNQKLNLLFLIFSPVLVIALLISLLTVELNTFSANPLPRILT